MPARTRLSIAFPRAPHDRPRWLTAGAFRLAVLCVFIALCGMLSPRLSDHGAGLILLVGALATVGALAAFVLTTRAAARRIGSALPKLSAAQRAADGFVAVLRQTGLPLLGLAFFLFWTFVYLGMWWYDPSRAFSGLDRSPRFADFFYYSVSTALISPPGDILAHSRGARSATMIEMLTGLALLGAYLSSFTDFLAGRGESGTDEPRD